MSTRTRGIIALAILIALAVVALVLSTAVPDDDQTVIFDVKVDADGKLAYIDMTGDYGFEDYLRHGSSDLDLTEDLSAIANVSIPKAITEIKTAPIRHTTICEVDAMPDAVKNFLGI